MFRNQKAMRKVAKKMEKEEINSLFRNTLGGSLKGGYAILWVSLFLKFLALFLISSKYQNYKYDYIYFQGGFIKVDLLTELIESESPVSTIFNEFGHNLISLINRYASAITTFRPIDKKFQDARNFYPGQILKELECNRRYPHPKWHVQSGIALVDFVFVADEIHHLIKKYENETN